MSRILLATSKSHSSLLKLNIIELVADASIDLWYHAIAIGRTKYYINSKDVDLKTMVADEVNIGTW